MLGIIFVICSCQVTGHLEGGPGQHPVGRHEALPGAVARDAVRRGAVALVAGALAAGRAHALVHLQAHLVAADHRPVQLMARPVTGRVVRVCTTKQI